MNDDPFDLQRFVAAQDRVFVAVQEELRQGHKRTHWMWFIFPQLAALGGDAGAVSGSRSKASRRRQELLADRRIAGPLSDSH